MKMRIYKKRRARYAKACNRDAKRLSEWEMSEDWHKALDLYADANWWYCHKSRQRVKR